MKNNDNVKQVKFVENNAVIIVLFVILIIVTPYITSIIGSTWKKADESSTKGVIESVKLLYTSSSVTTEVSLPFEVKYNRNGYETYSNGTKFFPSKIMKVDTEGQKPKSGTVTIKLDGTVSVKDLRFGLLKCNSDKNEKVTCGL